ncbi:hypothetical protein HOLleu_18339 [Holothuria leucospilota]|uniref:GIY-YIG domain-containing protein n=1 Tax=Holothuria leucospilota TaxID=206669 RepID=A0A9Q1C316_HOLLE|nr:hypothetical protein HOLleu_18339 [Holothuria leucospilota]
MLRQTEGAATGVVLAGDLASLFMVWWQTEFKRIMEREMVELLLFTRGERELREHVQYYIHRMQYSGYSVTEREEVYARAKKKFDEMLRKDREGTVPLYRPKEWKREMKDEEKKQQKMNWFRKGDYESVLFIDATPNSELARKCRKIYKECGLKVKVVEKTGTSVKTMLVKSNPFKRQGKSGMGEECKVCEDTEGELDCKKREVVYEIKCRDCDGARGRYIGESANSLQERYKQHKEKLKTRSKDSVFWKHMKEHHGGKLTNLDVKIIGSYPFDATLRQVSEAGYIRETIPDLNTKEEYRANTPRPRNISIQ